MISYFLASLRWQTAKPSEPKNDRNRSFFDPFGIAGHAMIFLNRLAHSEYTVVRELYLKNLYH